MTQTAFRLRAARSGDEQAIFALICQLGAYEKLSDAVTGSAEALAGHLFGPQPLVEVTLAEVEEQPVGFALYFRNYSTFLTRPGLHLEDLYVQPEYRGQGIGRALIVHLAKLAVERGYGRLEWSVLVWNEPAIGFYQHLGATLLEDWRICRVAGDALVHLADR